MEAPDQSGTAPRRLDAPKCVYVSKQGVFEQALQLLSLKIHEARACAVGNDQVIGSVCIDVPTHGEHPILHQQKFFGDYKMTEEDALESAILAALVYLQQTGIILVDDINLTELTRCETKLTECHHKLLAASSWATLFQEWAESLKIQLGAAREENKKLVHAAKTFAVKEEVSAPQASDLKTNVLPLQTVGIIKDTPTPPPVNNQPDSSLLQRGKKCTFHRPSAKRTLFKK